MWKKEEVKKIINMFNDGDNISEISYAIGKSKNAIYKKLIRLGYNIPGNKWTDEEIKKTIDLFIKGKNFKQISKEMNRSQSSITKKLNRLGYKYFDNNYRVKFSKKSKYEDLNWAIIVECYKNGMSQRDLMYKFKLSYQALKWGSDNNKIKFRSNTEGIKLAVAQGKMSQSISKKKGIVRYRQLCEFKFNLKDYPDEFDFSLIEKYGWYKAKNRGDNPGGISRDHMYSIKDGFINNIPPEIMSHPTNCKLMRQYKNNIKNSKSSITIKELYKRIEDWKKKYG